MCGQRIEIKQRKDLAQHELRALFLESETRTREAVDLVESITLKTAESGYATLLDLAKFIGDANLIGKAILLDKYIERN